MFSKYIFAAVILASPFCFAEDFHLMDASAMDLTSFAAPVVPNTTAVSNKVVGQIIYDSSANQFKGLDASGNWEAMTTGTGNAVISGGNERIERAIISCTTSSSVVSQSGNWISSISNYSSGTCTITVNTGVFSSAPTCTASVQSNTPAPLVFAIGGASNTSIPLVCSNGSGGACSAPYGINVICMGPR